MHDDLDHPAERVAVLAGGVHLGDHPLAGRRVGAAHRVLVDPGQVGRFRDGSLGRHRDLPERDHVGEDLHAEGLLEHPLGDLAERDPGGGPAGAGPLEDRPGVGVPELLHARQVRVAGPWPGQRRVAGLAVQVFPASPGRAT